MATDSSVDQAHLSKKLAQYRPRRTQRYTAVNVLLLSWKDGDTNIAKQVGEVATLFCDKFKYFVRPYEIPSKDSQRLLNLHVAQFIECFGGQDNLIIVYYGGHGGPSKPTETECEWAALNCGGPILDWSVIQPQFYGAGCEVVLLLDCCFAGQAVRNIARHTVELLAATDKDNWTPIGTGTWPSFTRVLIDEVSKMLSTESSITIPDIHRQMLRVQSGLRKQPFYVCMTANTSPGTIKLSRWTVENTTTEGSPSTKANQAFLDLRLRLFHPLDLGRAQSFLHWATRESPDFVSDVEILDHILAKADAVKSMGQDIIEVEDGTAGPLLPFLSEDGRQKAHNLLRALSQSMAAPQSHHLSDIEAIHFVDRLRATSDALASFIDDCVAALDTDALERLRSRDIRGIEDLRNRILMRLTLIGDDPTSLEHPIRVAFDDQSRPDQRLRMGKQQGIPTIVDYIYYDESVPQNYHRLARRIARVSALHAEKKNHEFRCLQGAGFSHETLHGPRFGMLYSIPNGKVGRRFRLLSELLVQVKLVPLELRYEIGYILCGALLRLHSIGWFHKAIGSNNILIFSSTLHGDENDSHHSAWDFTNPYIIGFDCSRPENAETNSTVDFNTANNIYRHPDRWGKPVRFARHHDLYALGIALIEIGFWKILTSLDNKRSGFQSVTDPEKFRDFLLGTVYERLAHTAGTSYSDAVRACIDRRDWGKYEGWQYQEEVRTHIRRLLRPPQENLRKM